MDTVDLVGVDILCPALRYIIFHFLKSLFKSSAVGLMHQLEVNSNYMISCVVTAWKNEVAISSGRTVHKWVQWQEGGCPHVLQIWMEGGYFNIKIKIYLDHKTCRLSI